MMDLAASQEIYGVGMSVNVLPAGKWQLRTCCPRILLHSALKGLRSVSSSNGLQGSRSNNEWKRESTDLRCLFASSRLKASSGRTTSSAESSIPSTISNFGLLGDEVSCITAVAGGTAASTLLRLPFANVPGLDFGVAAPFARARLAGVIAGEAAAETARAIGDDREALADLVDGGMLFND